MTQCSSPVVLIPARNEEATVGEVVCKILSQLHCEVVVIDDVSTDGTIEAARSAGATVLPLAIHLGAWGAIQTGMRYALKKDYRIAVTMDADGQHQASSVKGLIEPIRCGDADMVIGACVKRGSRARHLAWMIFRRLSGIGLEDLTSGFRAYNQKSMILLASRKATLLDYQDLGVLILLRRMGLSIVEKQVEMCPRLSGASRIFNSWWVVARYMLASSILCLAKR
ncbi:glycosyltransferase family 2 protein [Desulfoferrobacter suflitae]|uniref:glycosyltransferase family 2 protein n=1 Tax=Desulfoferrobacter suflitae TaxID=2865782 RepID=UPI0021648BB7|nr:glycosyltransferase family 2 protein [Desulfoferrobacter suflitae]MCK8603212.1 glycosyltransferase family 2 protein [Desulfoferrobacter suflitae]